MKKVLLSLLLSLSFTIPAYSAVCKYGDVVVCTIKAEKGDAEAQYNLGLMYYDGDDVAKDYKQAVKWFSKSADQGFAKAQYNLGYMYDNDQGVEQNFEQALKWYRKAAEQNDVSAQINLGFMYSNGRGVAQDYQKAYMWYNIASVSGDEAAIKNRGILETKMTSSQISKGEDSVEAWFAKHSKK